MSAIFTLNALSAQADPPRGNAIAPNAGTGCGYRMTTTSWSPADGAPARWVANYLRDGGCDVLLVLGGTAEGMWTVEGTVADASGYCNAMLVHTRQSGWRQEYLLVGGTDGVEAVDDATHRRVLQRLWRLEANGTWPLRRLERPHEVIASSYEPDDAGSNYPGYMVRVDDRAHQRVYDYRTSGERSMCWCFHSWHARVLQSW